MDNKQSVFEGDTGFLNQLNNALSDAVCVVNKDVEIVYHNAQFAVIFDEPRQQLSGKRFGASIGCRGHEKMYPDGICNNCKLRLSMLAAIITETNQEKETMVLEMQSGAKEELRLIRFRSNFMEYRGEKFAVVLLNDLTDMGNETLEFINRFYEEEV